MYVLATELNLQAYKYTIDSEKKKQNKNCTLLLHLCLPVVGGQRQIENRVTYQDKVIPVSTNNIPYST